MLIAARSAGGKGGCPLGSLGGQLAETDPEARALIAAGFTRWSAAIGDGLRTMQAAGRLPAGVTPDDLAVTLLAALQGGSSSPRSSATPVLWKPPSTPSSPSPPPGEPAPHHHRRGGTRPAPRAEAGGGGEATFRSG